jgi:hypothetical protein
MPVSGLEIIDEIFASALVTSLPTCLPEVWMVDQNAVVTCGFPWGMVTSLGKAININSCFSSHREDVRHICLTD